MIPMVAELEIRKKYSKGLQRKQYITTAVIHGAGVVDSAEKLTKWMLSGERKKDYERSIGLFHYAICKDGTVYEIINPEFWTFHSNSGIFDEHTIGIELINGNSMNYNNYTEEQYQSLFDLIFNKLKVDYPTLKSIASHGRLKEKHSGMYKNCPGNFDWQKLEDYMAQNNYSFQHNDDYESYWRIEHGK